MFRKWKEDEDEDDEDEDVDDDDWLDGRIRGDTDISYDAGTGHSGTVLVRQPRQGSRSVQRAGPLIRVQYVSSIQYPVSIHQARNKTPIVSYGISVSRYLSISVSSTMVIYGMIIS